MITGDTPMYGVYTFGKYALNYPVVLDLTYPVSERAGNEFKTANIEIGCVQVVGGEFFVSWYNHDAGTFGVDKIDYDLKLDRAYFETMARSVFRGAEANYTNFIAAYVGKPALTDIELEYSTDLGQNFIPAVTVDDTQRKIVSADSEGVSSTIIQLRVILRTSENDAPSIESAAIVTR